jgi:ankyrin repeat protein
MRILSRDERRQKAAAMGLKYDTPLVDAVAKGDADSVRRILASGADPNELAPMGGNSPLGSAHSTEIVNLLLDAGADPNLQDGMDFTPLMVAAMNGDFDVVKLLVERGADPDIIAPPNWKAWMQASAKGRTEIAAFLKALSSDAE